MSLLCDLDVVTIFAQKVKMYRTVQNVPGIVFWKLDCHYLQLRDCAVLACNYSSEDFVAFTPRDDYKWQRCNLVTVKILNFYKCFRSILVNRRAKLTGLMSAEMVIRSDKVL